MRKTNKFLTASLVLALAAVSLAGTAQADSKKWRANNNTDQTVKVFFAAEGCAGVKSDCKGNDVGLICKSTTLQPGEETDYEFNDGTSTRTKLVCSKDANTNYMASTSERKWNGIRLDANGHVEWYDE
ncbi:MAG TPA: hypothetical protein DC046_11720 [Rhodospirillaceae bacterium]|nr:hypothetical protein [Rhodospirillaceae bacterium]